MNLRGEFEFVAVNLNLLSDVEFAVVSLLQWIWICSGEFELAAAHLNLQWWIWICCD